MEHETAMRLLQTAREMTEAQSREIATRLLIAEALEISGTARAFVWFAANAKAGEFVYGLEANGQKITQELKATLRLVWEPSLQVRGPILLSPVDPLFAKFAFPAQKIIWAPFRYGSELRGGLVLADPHPEPAASNLALLGLFVDLGGTAINNVLRVERMAARIQYLSDYDDLVTKLPNQTFFKRRAAEMASQAESGQMVGMFFVDLDNFEQINRELGHALGDQFLAAAADCLKKAIDGVDAFVARLGGDEFGVLLSPEHKPARALACVQNLVAAFQTALKAAACQRLVTISVGVAPGPRPSESIDAWIQRAEHAMYAAKAGGGNAYCGTIAGGDTDNEPSRKVAAL